MYYEINGHILPQVRLIDKAVLEPPYVHKKRQGEEFILYVMTKGTLYLKEHEKEYILTEGDVILLDPDFVHQGMKASCCEYFYIHFRHPQITRRKESDSFWEKCLCLRSNSLKEDSGSWQNYHDSVLYFPKCISLQRGNAYITVVRLLQEAMEHNRNQLENYKVSCASRLMEAFVEIARAAVSSEVLGRSSEMPRSYHKAHELLGYLNTNYYKDVTSTIIEDEFSCNFDYLNKVFKKIIGKTIFVYLNEVRIQHACKLLATTSMKVAAISYRVGFQDEYYFSKVFKKYTGVSPGQYEKMTLQLTQEQTKPL